MAYFQINQMIHLYQLNLYPPPPYEEYSIHTPERGINVEPTYADDEVYKRASAPNARKKIVGLQNLADVEELEFAPPIDIAAVVGGDERNDAKSILGNDGNSVIGSDGKSVIGSESATNKKSPKTRQQYSKCAQCKCVKPEDFGEAIATRRQSLVGAIFKSVQNIRSTFFSIKRQLFQSKRRTPNFA